ncbi:MAG: SDR family oxidoreductase [Reyranellaceae bacterium]
MPANPFSLKGKVALITGAGRGLGFAMAEGLAQAGARVFLNGRDGAALRKAARRLKAAGLDAAALAFDITDEAAAQGGVDKLLRQAGRLDILVNNVGQRDRRPLEALAPADFAKLLQVDLVAAFALCRLAAPDMKHRGFGRIINVTSIIAALGRAGDPGYSAAKAGLEALTRALAADLGPHGITCNAISPGFFATETNQPMLDDPAIGVPYARRVPLGRWGRPEEIAGAAVFLASDAASYVNGHTLIVDGGVSATLGIS